VLEPQGCANQQLFGELRGLGEARPFLHLVNVRRANGLPATAMGPGWSTPRPDPRPRARPLAVSVLRPITPTPLACEVGSVTAVRAARLSGA
jgi:hypothetical protein